MNSAILPFTEGNSKRVASLFRQALRTAFDHSMKWELYRAEANKIRAQFEANKHISDPQELAEVISKCQVKLAEWKHPDPYITPMRPGGTKYQRNLELPKGPVITGDW